jgi:hypothetical protein
MLPAKIHENPWFFLFDSAISFLRDLCSGKQSRQAVCVEERGGAKEEGGARERERKEEGGAREVPPEKCQYLPKPESKTKESHSVLATEEQVS